MLWQSWCRRCKPPMTRTSSSTGFRVVPRLWSCCITLILYALGRSLSCDLSPALQSPDLCAVGLGLASASPISLAHACTHDALGLLRLAAVILSVA